MGPWRLGKQGSKGLGCSQTSASSSWCLLLTVQGKTNVPDAEMFACGPCSRLLILEFAYVIPATDHASPACMSPADQNVHAIEMGKGANTHSLFESVCAVGINLAAPQAAMVLLHSCKGTKATHQNVQCIYRCQGAFLADSSSI